MLFKYYDLLNISVKETIYSGYTHSSFTQLVVVGLTNDSRNATVFK